jgi:hypothetical protein
VISSTRAATSSWLKIRAMSGETTSPDDSERR